MRHLKDMRIPVKKVILKRVKVDNTYLLVYNSYVELMGDTL